MTLIRKFIRTAMVTAVVSGATMAMEVADIDLRDASVFPTNIVRAKIQGNLGVANNSEGSLQFLTLNPRLARSLMGFDPATFTNKVTQKLVYGIKDIYEFVIETYAQGDLDRFIVALSGLPVDQIRFNEFHLQADEAFLGLKADEIDRIGTAIAAATGTRISRYKDEREVAVESVKSFIKDRIASRMSGAGEAVKPEVVTTTAPRKVTAVSVPAPVVPIDPKSPAVLRDDATPEDAMAVLLINKTTHLSGCMYNIAFDPSLLLGLIPEDLKTATLQKPKVDRFRDSRVQNLITGIKLVYAAAMETIGHDKERFKNVLTRLNSEAHALVVPFKLNLDDEGLDFINPFTGFDVEFGKVTQLKESVKTGINKFLAPGETRTLDAEYAARQRVIDATRGTG